MLNFAFAIATAFFETDRRVRHPDVTPLQPDWPNRQRTSRSRDDAIADARRALDGVDYPFIL